MIIGKSSETSENFDKIIFAWRDIKDGAIPSFIKTIGFYAFSFCNKFQRIDIPSNSELQTIEDEAFICTSFKIITIRLHVKKICTGALSYCHKLKRIVIPPNSELQTIERKAFSDSSIESIFIPLHVTEISKYAFRDCYELKLIEIGEKSDIDLNNISYIFTSDSIIMIPIQ